MHEQRLRTISTGSRIEETYSYTDEQGQLLYEVVRKKPKRFVQRKPEGRGGWSYNLAGVRRVLYRLPEIQAAIGRKQLIVIAEGEKDANTAVTFGLCATTNAGGAGKWSEEYSKVLAGSSVAVLQDNDLAGRSHAIQVANFLHHVGASVRLIELPGLAEKEDFTDWVDHGGTLSEFMALYDSTPDYTPLLCHQEAQRQSTAQRSTAEVVCMAEVVPEHVEFLWSGRIVKGKLNLIEGPPDVGKTAIVCDLVARWSAGRPMPTEQDGRVIKTLMVELEDGLGDTIRTRLEAAGANLGNIHALRHVIGENELPRPLELPRDLDILEEQCVLRGAEVLIISPLTGCLAKGLKLVNEQDMRQMLTPLVNLAARANLTIIAIRHLRKMPGKAVDAGLGAIAITAAARSVLAAGKHPTQSDKYVLARSKGNLSARPDSLSYRLVEDATRRTVRVEWMGTSEVQADDLTAEFSIRSSRRSALGDAKEFLKELLNDQWISATQVQADSQIAGHSPATIRRACTELGVTKRKTVTGWMWSLSSDQVHHEYSEDAQGVQGAHICLFEHLEHLDQDEDE